MNKQEALEQNKKRAKGQNKFQSKINGYRKQAKEMEGAIYSFIQDEFGIEMPKRKDHWLESCNINPKHDGVNRMYGEVINLMYSIRYCSYSVESIFEQDGKTKGVPVMHHYTRNRIEPVWNYRKSQMIRSRYRSVIKDDKLFDFHPVHIVLTVPHDKNGYKGKKQYGSTLLASFNTMRKRKFWKKSVYAGEYGLEATYNGEHGQHIHIHSFALLYNGASVNKFRDELQQEWEKITGAKMTTVETLYYVERKANNHRVKIKNRKTGKMEKKKIYLDKYIRDIKKDKTMSDEEKEREIIQKFTWGVMECIKYHYKTADLKMANGHFDVELMNEILKDTKNKRLYGRFGKFYNDSRLNFNNHKMNKEDIEDEAVDEEEDTGETENENDVDNDVELSGTNERTVINPFTFEEVPVSETQIALIKPEWRNHYPKNHPRAYETDDTDPDLFIRMPEHMEAKYVARLLMSRRLDFILSAAFSKQPIIQTKERRANERRKAG